jgi:acetyl esterase/lipase
MKQLLGVVALVGLWTITSLAQITDQMARLENDFRVVPDITYLTATGMDAKLDLFVRRGNPAPQPTLIFIHGGGWTGGSKEQRALAIQPYLAMGLNVVNVEYRLAKIALAPAAVEDSRCALKWVYSHAKEFGIDTQKLVVAGDSAGGHLAMMTGFLPSSAGMERQCGRNDYLGSEPVPQDMKVAAVVNWYGISDVNDLLDGPNMRPYAVTWLGSLANRSEVAKAVSPMTYVRAGLPPVLSIHGDADPTVPYQQSVALHKALAGVGVSNELMTIPGGKHGLDCCNLEQRIRVYQTIQTFLRKQGVLPTAVSSLQ